MLTDGGLALSERNAVGARGSTKVLAASSLGSCLVFVTGSVVTAALAAIDRDMRLSPLDLQWVMNAELLPLAGMLCRRFGRRLPLFAGGAVVASGCAMALHIGSNAIYWAEILPHPVARAEHEPGDRAVDDPRPHLRSRHARGVHYRAGAPRRLHPARLTRSVSAISRPARPGRNNEERRPTYRQKEKAHEDPNHNHSYLHRPRFRDGRLRLRP
jgi:hypothetical protein